MRASVPIYEEVGGVKLILKTRIFLEQKPQGFPFKGVLFLVLLLLLFVPTKARLRVNRSMEHRGSTSHLFDPRNFRTMILLFKLPSIKGRQSAQSNTSRIN